MKRLLSTLFVIVALHADGTAAERQAVQIYSESTYVLQVLEIVEGKKGRWWWSRDEPSTTRLVTVPGVKVSGRGTGWVVRHGKTSLVVTAAHVLGLTSVPKEIGEYVIGEDCEIVECSTKVYVGGLALEPQSFGWLAKTNAVGDDDRADVAVLKFRSPEVFDGIATFELSNTIPKLLEEVTVIGFPGTSFPRLENASVVQINPASRFFVVDRALDTGFSGGVVRNRAGRALGVYIGDKGGQGTVMLINGAELARTQMRPYSEIATSRKYSVGTY